MKIAQQIAHQVKGFHYGPNATGVNLRELLADLTYEEAVTQVHDCNTIYVLLFHINYYIKGVLPVFDGRALTIRDKYSFDCPELHSQEEWEQFLESIRADADKFIAKVEAMSDAKLWEAFADEKYGNFFKNIHGNVEHSHYHLGQISLLKKIIRGNEY